MDLQYLRKLVKLVNDSQIAELEIEEDGNRVRITQRSSQTVVMSEALQAPVPAVHPVNPAPQAPVPAPAAAPPPKESDDSKYQQVRSPIVGTFYRAASPDAEPFVQVGNQVSAGSTLCIIEAMKIMNEIEAEISGKIVKILVENGKPVEYDQPLFLVEPS